MRLYVHLIFLLITTTQHFLTVLFLLALGVHAVGSCQLWIDNASEISVNLNVSIFLKEEGEMK
jgi:hypothetical protein